MREKTTVEPAPERKSPADSRLRGSAAGAAVRPGVGDPVAAADSGYPAASPEIQRAFLEQLFESAPEAITILGNDYRILRVNTEFTRLFGYTPEEAIGQPIELIVPREKRQESQWIADTVSQGAKISLETRRRRKDGTLVDVSILGTPVKAAGGQVALYAIYRDITENKRSGALQSALYRIAEKTASGGDLEEFYGAIHGIVGELMCARNFYIALYDEAGGMLSFDYFVDEEDPTPAPKKLGKGLTEYVLRRGEPLLATPEVFDELVRQDKVQSIGAPSVDWLGVPLKAGNKTIGVLVVQSYSPSVRFGEVEKDILTFVSQHVASAIEYKRQEEALRRSEARYRSLVHSAVYGIYRSSLEGKFLDVNPALITMLGYESAAEVLALEPARDIFLNPQEQDRLTTEYQRAGRVDHLEVGWKRKDGSPITVRLSGRAVGSQDGSPQVLEMIAEDVTERRVLENQLRQAQKMEAVGRLAGGVAHDFNNLLMVIGGYTEIMLSRLAPNDALRKKVEAIQKSTEKASALTRQLLAFGRKQVLEPKVIDLNTVVTEMERLLRPLIGEDINLLTVCAPDLGRVKADPGQIEQVILNLTVNARDAMPKGGKLILETCNLQLDDVYRRAHASVPPGPYVMLAVSDTGCGMTAEVQSRIFEPFFTTKEKGKGTGLGLSTAYGIVKQSGGYIFVYSEPGQGTTFKIYLPRVEEAGDRSAASQAPRAASPGTETLLLVEDEESVRELVRETLEGRGYKVLIAANGEQALQIAEQHSGSIHMVMTDVVMPGMNGRDLAKRLSAACPESKVLYISGYTEDAIVHHGVIDPGTAFLQKPFTLESLARKVRQVLDAEIPR